MHRAMGMLQALDDVMAAQVRAREVAGLPRWPLGLPAALVNDSSTTRSNYAHARATIRTPR